MRPIVTTVGPLAAASATAIGALQTVPAAASLVIDSTLSTGYSANNIATAQAVGGAGALVLNGSLVSGGVAYLTTPRRVVIVSAGNDTGITFTVSGLASDGRTAVTETVTGANASRTSTSKVFYIVNSVTASGAAAGNVSVGTNGYAIIDHARRIVITSGGDDSSLTFGIYGTDWAGNPISESLAGANGAATSALDFATVAQLTSSGATAGTVTIGTSAVAGSPWVRLDEWAPSTIAVQCTVSGTVNYTLQQTLDDPNSVPNPVARESVTWANSADTNVVAATTTQQTNYFVTPIFARVLLNSGSGTVTATYVQSSNVPF